MYNNNSTGNLTGLSCYDEGFNSVYDEEVYSQIEESTGILRKDIQTMILKNCKIYQSGNVVYVCSAVVYKDVDIINKPDYCDLSWYRVDKTLFKNVPYLSEAFMLLLTKDSLSGIQGSGKTILMSSMHLT